MSPHQSSDPDDAPEPASDRLLDEAAFFIDEGTWYRFGAGDDILGVRFPEDPEPWYSVLTGPEGGVGVHGIFATVGGWILLRGADGLRVAEAITDGADAAALATGAAVEFLAMGIVRPENVSDEDAAFAEAEIDATSADCAVFRARTSGDRLAGRPDATDQSRLERALSALRRACDRGDLPPVAWDDPAAIPFVATLAPEEQDAGPFADGDEDDAPAPGDAPPAPVTWERPRGGEVRPLGLSPALAVLPTGDAVWAAGLRSLGAAESPAEGLFVVDATAGTPRVAEPATSANPQTLVRRVALAVLAAGVRPASIAFEGAAAAAIAEATFRPLGIAVTACAAHAAIDAHAAALAAREQELQAIADGKAVPRDDDTEGWDLVVARVQDAIDARLESEQRTAAESVREYFGVRAADLDPGVDALGFPAFQDWRALRPNPTGDRRSPVDRILRSDGIGAADRVLLEALRDAPLALWRVERTDPGRREGDVGPLRVADDETGRVLEVRTPQMSHVPCEGDRFAGRALKAGSGWVLTQASPVLVAAEVESAREHLRRFGGDLTAKSMNSRPALLGRLWDWALVAPDDGAPPPDDLPPYER